jgi:hypothetical protein
MRVSLVPDTAENERGKPMITDKDRALLTRFLEWLIKEKGFAVMSVRAQSLCDVTPETSVVVAEFLEGEGGE